MIILDGTYEKDQLWLDIFEEPTYYRPTFEALPPAPKPASPGINRAYCMSWSKDEITSRQRIIPFTTHGNYRGNKRLTNRQLQLLAAADYPTLDRDPAGTIYALIPAYPHDSQQVSRRDQWCENMLRNRYHIVRERATFEDKRDYVLARLSGHFKG